MSRISTFSTDATRLIAREVFREARDAVDLRHRPQIVQPVENRDVAFRNTSGETIPPYAVMRVTGAELRAGLPIVTVAKPSTTFQRLYLVNGPLRVGSEAQARGVGTWLNDAGFVLYESGTPANGESWGPKASQWSLAKWRYGFTITGAVDSTGLKVLATQAEVNEVYGQTNGTHTKNTSSAIDLYDGNNAVISSTSITATNRFATVPTAKKVICKWIGGTWLTSAAECG